MHALRAYTSPIDVWGMVSPPRDDQQSVTMFARRYAVQFLIVKTSSSAVKFSRRSIPLRTLRVKRALGLDYELRMILSFMRN